MKEPKITILGGGSWGTVLGHMAAVNQVDATLWMRNKGLSDQINLNHINLTK